MLQKSLNVCTVGIKTME